ncbi:MULTISPECIES: ATP-binding protein [Pseudoalteromonas]|uniref:Histidine kinase/HSP90-like ATPase domain-containing protein n=1 Tax=Pseudoalteromonas amylolytica TaxID=1859457 RepID=A0A1S1MXH7_9GAMM|nr:MULTISPECIES: ATP-binding protein [Pseudoalteromonas]OHU85511.1 hypothetical protein BFC16_19375 [Pseudoalteromonas sp. JW3]OHU91745.1 hypothetical protein BET10_08070 [Pseudoalteromonas amylolytica]
MRVLLFLSSLIYACCATAFDFENLNAVEQDATGNFYLSSHNGVYRYDGRHYIALSDVAELPNGLVRDIEYHQEILFTLYANGDIWRTNLTTFTSERIATVSSTKIAVTNTELLTLSASDVKQIDIDSGVVKSIYNGVGRVIDLDSFGDSAYLMTSEGVFLVKNGTVTVIEAVHIKKGDLGATPHGVVYFANDRLSYYSTIQQKIITNTSIKDADNVIFAAPYFVYITENENVHELTLSDLKVSRTAINPRKNSYSELFSDNKNRIWGIGLNSFEPVEIGLKSTPINLGSKYNVIEWVAGDLWLGTTKGLYVKQKDKYEPIDWVSEQITLGQYEVTAMQLFRSGVAIGTSLGAYYVDLRTKSVTKLHSDYVLNFAVANSTLHIATNETGVISVSDDLELLPNKQLQELLPSFEVLDFNIHGQSKYISTTKGLLHVKANNWSELTLDVDAIVTDSFVLNNTLYAATYGMGLWQKHDGQQWEQLSSPKFVKELVEFNSNLYLSTNNGVHILEHGKSYTKLITGTESHSFTIGSLKALGERLYAASTDHIFELTTASSVELNAPRLTSIVADNKVNFRINDTVIIKPNIEITVSDYQFFGDNNNVFEFQLNDNVWQRLFSPGVQLHNLKPGSYTAAFRIENQGRYSPVTEFSFQVTAPWYSSPTAFMAYVIVTLLIGTAVTAYLYFWIQSFHKVFRKNQQRYQSDELSDAVLKVHEAKALCGGDPTMVTEGLVKLDDALYKLDPLARGQAALGKEKLKVAIDMLQVHCSITSDLRLDFGVSLGDERLERQLEKDIYSVIYHSVDNTLKHATATTLKLNVHRYLDTIHVSIEDNGKGINLYSRFHFGTGIYSMRRIAKTYKTRLNVKASKKGTKVAMIFPLLEVGRVSRDDIQKEVMERM